MKRTHYIVLVVILVMGSFAYGFLVERYKIFPYSLMKMLFNRTKSATVQDKRSGRWYLAHNPHKTDEKESDKDKNLSQLSALPYLQGSNLAGTEKWVTQYNEQKAHKGLNLFNSGHKPCAYLMDMKGQILHEWNHLELTDVWPEELDFIEPPVHRTFWRRVHLFPNGDILANFEGIGLIKLDKESNLIWAHQGREHHDIFVDETGKIYSLTRHPLTEHDKVDIIDSILEDFIIILDPNGNEIKSISIIDAFMDTDYSSALFAMGRRGDALHTNTIEVLDGKHSGTIPMFKKGHILISIRQTNTIAIIDPETEKVTWAMYGLWKAQHQPTVLDNGNILLFDNRGNHGYSKVIEFNPLTQNIVWAFRGSKDQYFYTKSCGSNQRLPNGNTLVTESDNGRAFEVTRDKNIVWEFYSPFRAGENNELVATLFEVIRIDPDYVRFMDID